MGTAVSDINLPIPINFEKIAIFCRKWKVKELSLFGSILRDDFGPQSDVDFLVEFEPDASWSLLDLIGAERELADLLGRHVDLVERCCVEGSHNWIRRRHILENARRVYVA